MTNGVVSPFLVVLNTEFFSRTAATCRVNIQGLCNHIRTSPVHSGHPE
jgi:hypothetical protein